MQAYADTQVNIITVHSRPGRAAQILGTSSCTPKGCGFDPWSGHVWEATDVSLLHQCFSLPLPISLKSISLSSNEDKKKRVHSLKVPDFYKILQEETMLKLEMFFRCNVPGHWWLHPGSAFCTRRGQARPLQEHLFPTHVSSAIYASPGYLILFLPVSRTMERRTQK